MANTGLKIWLLLVSFALSGCLMPDPPIKIGSTSAQTQSRSITVDGAIADHWHSYVEPIVQEQCIACHNANDTLNTGLSFQPSELNQTNENLINLLLITEKTTTLNMSASHPQPSPKEQSYFEEFEYYSALYWNWQSQIQTAKSQANGFFDRHLEADIIQPVCTGCHVFIGEDQQTFAGDLGFYEYYVNNHSELNRQQAMDFLVDHQQADLLYSKAIGMDHGGATVIRPNTEFSDLLLQHSLLMDDVIQLMTSPPY